tara:strand:- start:564 stop:992 length:429 start_codon:yes stop_codon:yes gene_type:complete
MTVPLHTLSPEQQILQRAKSRAYHHRNLKKRNAVSNAYHKRRYATDPEYKARKDHHANESRLRNKYGMGSEERDAMLAEQGGTCEICKVDAPKFAWHIDHCHTSGKVRAILCESCNVFLGKVEKDLSRLRDILIYIQRHSND